ncbi:MAG: hypothetical protein ACRCXA_07515 [Peptostreptococcaceae bacterium]
MTTDVKTSIKKLKKIIEIIEENLISSKERILLEIVIQLDINEEAARKIFAQYYPKEGIGLPNYIKQRKRSQVEVYNVENLEESISECYDNLFKLKEEGLVDIDVFRTKINLKNINWNVGLRSIFSMREYIYFEEDNDIKKLITYDMFLNRCEELDNVVDDYDPFKFIDLYKEKQIQFKEDMNTRLMDFVLFYSSGVRYDIGDLIYYFVDKSIYKEVVDEFVVPIELKNYRTVLYKTRTVLELMGKGKDEWKKYFDEFKNMIDDDLERKVFTYIVEAEFNNREGFSFEEINLKDSIKSLLLKGFISLK